MTGVTSVAVDSGRTEIMATEAESVVRELLSRDASLANLEVGSVGLEDAFLSLIEKAEAA